jgi:hypothetical protein
MKAWNPYKYLISWIVICAKTVEGSSEENIFYLLIFDVVHLPCNSPIHKNFTINFLYNIYYTKLLHVSAIHLGHLQGATSLIDVCSIYGNWS